MATEICQGIILTTKKPCTKPAVKNGFCGKHQEQLFLKQATEEGKTVCRMFARGCRNYLVDTDLSNNLSSCEICRIKLSGKEKACGHPGCGFKVEESGTYCGKHYRDVYKNTSVNYCNIPRGCNSILKDGEKICQKCIKKQNDKVYDELKSFRQKAINCLKCDGIKEISTNYFCAKCEPAINFITEAISDRKINDIWRDYCKGTVKRDLTMPISYEKFVDQTIRPCFYCNRFSENKYNGIDRYDNKIGYTEENVRPCCTNCNMMKNDYNPNAFIDKIDAIVSYKSTGESKMGELVKTWPELMSKNKDGYKTYKRISENVRRIEFILSEAEYEAFKKAPCYLCGIKSDNNHINGIDRIDNSIGYTLENCKPCCGHCNTMKGSLSFDEFIHQCRLVNKYHAPVTNTKQHVFTAKEVYSMIESGKLETYIDIAKKEGKSIHYIVGIKGIDIKSVTKEDAICEIKRQMEHERSRLYKSSKGEAIHYSAATVYNMLISGEAESFTNWYNTNYGLSNSFHTKLKELVESLKLAEKKQAIDLCRDFLNGERSRRQSMLVSALKKKSSNEKKERCWKASKLLPMTDSSNFGFNDIADEHNAAHENSIIPTPILADTPIVTLVETGPKQWKSDIIYNYIIEGKGSIYKQYCEENNVIEDPEEWHTRWNMFEGTVSVVGSFESAKEIIIEFVALLRKTRALKLLEKNKRDILDREDREIWPKETILKAYLSGKMDDVKAHYDSKSTQGSNWEKRWAKLVKDLGETKKDSEKLELIRKFQNNHRKSCYEANKAKPN
jgi:hypothetical protein